MQRFVRKSGKIPVRHMHIECKPGEVFLVHKARDLFPSPGLFVLDVREWSASENNHRTDTPYLVTHQEAFTHAFLISEQQRDFLLERIKADL